MEGEKLVAAWRGIIGGPEKSWCCSRQHHVAWDPCDDIAPDTAAPPGEQATPVRRSATSPRLNWRTGGAGVVTCCRNGLSSRRMRSDPSTRDLVVRLLGRSAAGRTEDLKVIHEGPQVVRNGGRRLTARPIGGMRVGIVKQVLRAVAADLFAGVAEPRSGVTIQGGHHARSSACRSCSFSRSFLGAATTRRTLKARPVRGRKRRCSPPSQ